MADAAYTKSVYDVRSSCRQAGASAEYGETGSWKELMVPLHSRSRTETAMESVENNRWMQIRNPEGQAEIKTDTDKGNRAVE